MSEAASGRSVTLSDMYAFAAGEAYRIETTQAALITAGMRSAPDAGQLRNKETCEGICRLIERLRAHPKLLEMLKA